MMTKEESRRMENKYNTRIKTITFGVFWRQLDAFDLLKKRFGDDFNRSEIIRTGIDLYFKFFLRLADECEGKFRTIKRLDLDNFLIINGKIREIIGEA